MRDISMYASLTSWASRDDFKVPLLDLFIGQHRIRGERRPLADVGGHTC